MAMTMICRKICRPLTIAVTVAVMGLSGPTAFSTSALAKQGPESVADLAESLQDAVVNISTAQTVEAQRSVPMPQVPEGSPFQEFFEEFFNRQNRDNGQPRKVQSLGSGFVIDGKEGIVITNNHVIEGADEITVNFNDGEKLIAEVIGRDKKTDIAVLKVTPEEPLKDVKFGDSGAMRVGDWVMAIGNPFGLGGTVTVGIISARNRDINSGPYDNFIQTDAAINRGNSGGPLFNLEGEVIGINTAIISPSGGSIGIGFAIPSTNAKRTIAQLREYGETRRGWLGVRIQEVTDEIAESLGMDEAGGALVAGVTAEGPAAEAKIEPGDVILKFDGSTVPTMRELPRMVANTEIGSAVEVIILRKGEEKTLKVELGRLEEGEEIAAVESEEPVEEEEKTDKVIGLTLSGITDALREKFELESDVKGVVITEVETGSAAEEKRITAGDVIVEVAQETVETPADIIKQIGTLKKDGRGAALLLLSNGKGELRFVAVKIDS